LIGVQGDSGEITAHEDGTVLGAAGDDIRDVAVSGLLRLALRDQLRQLTGGGWVRVEQIGEPDLPLGRLDDSDALRTSGGDVRQLSARHVQAPGDGRVRCPAAKQACHPLANPFEGVGHGSRHDCIGRQ
jgi:hypothetical protein